MPQYTYRELKPTAEAESTYRRWLAQLNEEFTRHQTVDRRSEIVRDELYQMYLGRPHGGRTSVTLTSELASHALTECFDPRNVTLEPEYYGEVCHPQASDLVLADVRPIAAGAESLARLSFPLHAGASHLQIAGQGCEDLPQR